MDRAIEHIPCHKVTVAGTISGTVTLAFDERHRRRIRLYDDAGAPFMLDLPHAVRMGHGDLLRLDSGSYIQVQAAVEPVLEVSASDPIHAARLAWHVGNRHSPCQILADGRLRILDDHVMQHMIEGLGGTVTKAEAAFDPENGAYSGGQGHGHSHGNDHWDKAEEGHDHGHDHDHGAAHAH